MWKTEFKRSLDTEVQMQRSEIPLFVNFFWITTFLELDYLLYGLKSPQLKTAMDTLDL